MPSAGVSAALAAFVVAPHRGAEYAAALRSARASLAAKPLGDGTPEDPILTAAYALTRGDDDAPPAVVVGRELAMRLRRAMRFDPAWDGDAIADALGAAAAAARAAGLDAERAGHALGLAATQASALGIERGTPSGTLVSRKAANDAVEAAVLAAHGFTASEAWLEGRRGLAALMAERLDEDALRRGLGERWISAGG